MTKEEYMKFVKESYKEIFKDKYDEKRAEDSANAILVESNNDLEKAKAAAEVIIARTKAKMTASEEKYHDAGKPMIEVTLGGKRISICPKTGSVLVDGKLVDYIVDTKKPISEIYGMIAEKLGAENKPTAGKITLHDALEEVKSMVKEGPKEVKESFNCIVKYLKDEADKKETK